MVGSSWSSSSSCTSSFGSLDDDVVCIIRRDAVTAPCKGSVKFLCSYGGRILPRHTDGALRYVGGHNRVLSVDRSIHFYELQRKLRTMCGWDDVCLRCQLPTEDLDALVSVTSDDDLANLLEEYDAARKDRLQLLKIRAFLFRTTPAPSHARNGHRNGQNSSIPGPADHMSSPTCGPRWWATPQASSRQPGAATMAQQPPQLRPHRCLVHNGSHRQC